MKVLITGAAGFLGSAIVRQAVGAGLSVTATDKSASAECNGVDFLVADILDPPGMSKAFRQVDCVCHAAGLAHIFDKSAALKAPFHTVNVVGSENVARLAARAGVEHFVFISSRSVYGGGAQGKDEDAACHPEEPYAASKLQAEERLIELCQKEGMNLTILRLAPLYGPGDRGNVLRLIRSLDRGRFLWIGKGENLMSILHCEDAARACMAVIRSNLPGINIFNVAAPACKMREIVTAISHSLGKSVPSWHIPASLALTSIKIIKLLLFNHSRIVTIHETLQKWLADNYYNTDKFLHTFNFQTKIRLEEGINQEVAWYENQTTVGS
jgi:nucleoside-diphosphate-sugar epimerase